MNTWILLVILAACAAAFVTVPFLRPRKEVHQAGSGTDIYRQQLHELAQEVAAGEVDTETAAGERTTIERRILSETPAPETVSTQRADRLTAIGVAVVVVLGAVCLYAVTGQPTIPSSPHGAEAVAANAIAVAPSAMTGSAPGAQQPLADVDTMIAGLAARLNASSNDPEGWKMLGWSYFSTKHYPEAVEAYARAVALKPDSAPYQSAFGEAQILAAGGTVTDSALKALNVALATAPDDERAHYYIGLHKSQKGDLPGALSEWNAALKKSAPDSVWAPRLREQIAQQPDLKAMASIAQQPPVAPKPDTAIVGPSPRDVQQAQAMSPQDRQAMIAGMVEGLDQKLKQNPNDPDGWVRLIRSRMVMGQGEQARQALSRALAAFHNDKVTQQKIAATALALGVSADR